MSTRIAIGISLALGFAAASAAAATKPPAAQKAPPSCAAISFRPVPSGMADGEQQAGMYKSRHARLELHAQVKQGEPVDYFVIAGGKRLAAALENGKEIYGRVREKAVEGIKAGDQVVRENPYQAIGIALGVGALLGFLIGRRCSRND